MNFESRLADLERRMESFESMKKKRKADVLFESSDEEDVDMNASAAGAAPADSSSTDAEEILKGVLRHSKPSGEFEWARKQINLAQTEPADLDRYFTALIAALVVHGFLDSYTAWMNRFVSPLPPTGVLKGRAVEAYVSKNLLMMLNLQPLSRGRKAKEDALSTLKRRSTYDKVMECARAVSRGEILSYEPSPAALQLSTVATTKKNAGGRKKKLLVATPPASEDEAEDEVEDEAEAEGEAEEEAEDEEEEEVEVPKSAYAFMIGKGKGMSWPDDGVDATQAQVATQLEVESEASEAESAAESSASEAESEENVESEAHSEVRVESEVVPVVEFKKVDLFSMPSSSSLSTVAPTASSAVTAGSTAGSLRSRFLAKKVVSVPSVPHPMMQESTPMDWEPLDVNRRSMVQTPTGAWDSYLNWRKAFEADPRFENRYTEYTRPDGDRSSLTGYYVRFFNAWPSIVSAEEVASMPPQKADSMYMRWLQSLSTTKTKEEIREKLL